MQEIPNTPQLQPTPQPVPQPASSPPTPPPMSAPPQKNNTTKYILGGCAGCGCLTILVLFFIFFVAAMMNSRTGGQSGGVSGSNTTIAPRTSDSDDDESTDDQSGVDESETNEPVEDSGDQASAPADDMKNAVGQCAYDVKDGMLYGRIESYVIDMGSGEVTYKIAAQGGTVWTKKAANIRVGTCQ